MTRVVILCGGVSKRWKNHLGINKQFIKIQDKVLIENTVKQFKRYFNDILIVVNQDSKHLFKYLGCKLIVISSAEGQIESYKFRSHSNYWYGVDKIIIVMGDVLFTENSVQKICRSTLREILFFGRQRRSFYTKSKHGEIFAISFYEKHKPMISQAVEKLVFYEENLNCKVAAGWGVYNILNHLDFLFTNGKIVKGKAVNKNFIHILDRTDDVDNPDDYENLKKSYGFGELRNSILALITLLYHQITLFDNFKFGKKLEWRHQNSDRIKFKKDQISTKTEMNG